MVGVLPAVLTLLVHRVYPYSAELLAQLEILRIVSDSCCCFQHTEYHQNAYNNVKLYSINGGIGG